MLMRCSLSRAARSSARPLFICRRARVCRRGYASTTQAPPGGWPNPAPAASPPPHVLGGLVSELDKIAPRFEIDPEAIEILRGPVEFYEALKSKISKAKHRIYLSTLYIGKTEHELISTVRTALHQNPDLKISFLTDALRGTREAPKPSCASLLAPLVTEFGPARVEVRMYHTPNLTGLRKRLVPARINEGWGLQHMKLYGVDDELIMSGANLSDDYFTNRQDRYHVFRSRQLTDYYARVHDAICSISFAVLPAVDEDAAGFTMEWPASNTGPSPLADPKGYISHASTLLGLLIGPTSSHLKPPSSTATLIYPLFQVAPLLSPSSSPPTPITATSTELPALHTLLESLRRPPLTSSTLIFTAGYFNPPAALTSLLLSSTATSLTVIAASPHANGFYGSPGISGLLPAAYTLLCRRFVDEVARRGLADRVKVLEWRRGTVGQPGGWTYHAKGIWVTPPRPSGTLAHKPKTEAANAADEMPEEADPGPAITLVGSSNYTTRSASLDLEANTLVLTSDPGLRRRLGEEVAWLAEGAREVGPGEFERTERRVGWHVRVAMWIVGVLGGSL